MLWGSVLGLGATEEGGTFLAPTARLELQRDMARVERSRTGFLAEGPESTRVEFEHRRPGKAR